MLKESKFAQFPTPLTSEQTNLLLYWVEQDLLLSNGARHIGVTPSRLMRLMDHGADDLDNDNVTPFAQLYVSVSKKQAEKISKLLKMIEDCPKNWQALAWKLEKCFKEEFSSDAPEFKHLVEKYLKLQDAYESLVKKQSLQGVTENG